MPLTSTNTWSGARPRSCAGRTASVPSVIAGRGKFSEGSARDSAVANSTVPVASSASGVMTSIGAADSATVLLLARVPVITTVSRVLAASAAGGDWEKAAGDARAASRAMASGE